MARIQISSEVSFETRRQFDSITAFHGYSNRETLTLAIQALYEKMLDDGRPRYNVDLSTEEVARIHKSLRMWKERSKAKHDPETYNAIQRRNHDILTNIDVFRGYNLTASDIGYIRMCLGEYGRAQTGKIMGGQHIEDEFHALNDALSKKLDEVIDPKAERAYSLIQRRT